MDSGQLIFISTKLILGGAAAVFAIAVWARTREAPWLFVVLGILSFYADTIFTILEAAGFTIDFVTVYTIPLPSLILAALPPFFFIIAFIIMLVKKSRV